MDHFGIGQAVNGILRIYFRSARRTGRTTSLIDSVKDGDRLVFASNKEMERVKRFCKDRGVKVECIVIDPLSPHRIFERGTSIGRTIFDHGWLEQYYLDAAEKNQRFIDHLERETSGYGEAHRETQRRAEEMARYSPKGGR